MTHIGSTPQQPPQVRPRVELISEEKATQFEFSSPIGRVYTENQLIVPAADSTYEDLKTKKIPKENSRRHRTNSKASLLKKMRTARNYHWPTRNRHSNTRQDDFNLLHRHLLQQLKPCSVVLEAFTEIEVRSYTAVKSLKVRLKPLNDSEIKKILGKR
jgi:hypothetical protein